jgi:t-SNARE complex subunit (syntaxin)
MYLGFPHTMKTPQDKIIIYLIVAIVALLVIYMILGAILTAIMVAVLGIGALGMMG